MKPLCSISVDVDPLPCYYRIHALGASPAPLREVVVRRCLPRFADVFAEHGIAATFFVVAEDIDVDARGGVARAARAVFEELASHGHELANHSYSHPYDLARRSRAEVETEIGRAHELLSELAPVHGFRAPGYDLSPAILEALSTRDYRYDSSIFPAPGYYLAKAVVMAALRVMGRESGAVLTNPLALAAPADPYRPRAESPWRRGGASLIEMPIAVTPLVRTPAIGTNLFLAPAWLRDHWLAAMTRRPHFNFELHGIDLCDAETDGIPGQLVARQPDLRVPLARKLARFAAILRHIAARFEIVTLEAAAARHADLLPA